MTDAQKKMAIMATAALVVLLAITFMVRQATQPNETINRYEDVPAKGAGKNDPDRKGGGAATTTGGDGQVAPRHGDRG